jgi:hypothetical protein
MDGIFNYIVVSWLNFYNSSFFLFLKILILIYVCVLVADIVMLFFLRGIRANWRLSMKGADMPLISQKNMNKKWEKIKDRLESGNIAQYKLAVLEADQIVDEILQGMKIKGENMAERLEKSNSSQIFNIEALLESHKIRNRVVAEPDFSITKEEAKKAIDPFEDFLKHFEYL